MEEAVWRENGDIGPLNQASPNPGAPPTEPTRVWLAYSRNALYIAVRCLNSDGKRIVSRVMRRDSAIAQDDNVEIVLDTYHDHRNAYYFATTPAGALVDGRVVENQKPTVEWDGIWTVRTRIDSEGWTAEFEIPFKTLGFNPEITTWGFNISRNIARAQEQSRWASPTLDALVSDMARAGEITGLEGLSQGVGLDVKPYLLGGYNWDATRAKPWDSVQQPGVDVFYRVASNLVSATTFNTDFAETEADARQVNLTRFPLYFPEKRSFFVEDAGIFSFAPPVRSFGSPELVPFFSRTIGLVGDGLEAPIRAGEKLTGTVGRFDIGLLGVRTGDVTDESGSVIPGSMLSVARVKTHFWSQSYIGGIFTNGDPEGRTTNRLGGVDLRLATANFLNTRRNFAIVAFDSGTRTSGVRGQDNAYGAGIAYPNDFLSADYTWIRIGKNYNPALGFVPRKGVDITESRVAVSPRPRYHGIRQLTWGVEYWNYYNLVHRAVETNELRLTPFEIRTDRGEHVWYAWTREVDRLFAPWEIRKGIWIPAGRYLSTGHTLRIDSANNKPVWVTLNFWSGTFYAGTHRQAKALVNLQKHRHFATSLEFDQDWVRLPNAAFRTRLVAYQLNYSFTPFISLANYVQYDTDSANIGLQSRFRWIVRPGREFFVVINHGWRRDPFDRFESAQSRFRVKLDYTFRF